MSDIENLIDIIKDKKLYISTHWDADGVSSGALIYHFFKKFSNITGFSSKGLVFRINKEDILSDYDYVVVSDIIPGDLEREKVIYFDHHPNDTNYFVKYHDEKEQSTTIVIWKNLVYPGIIKRYISVKEIPYLVFLTLLGYFGDGGKVEKIPMDLYVIAKEAIPELMIWKDYGNRSMLEIEKYVSLLNIGKRTYWNGSLPLQMLITSTKVEDIIFQLNPLAKVLNNLKEEIKDYYDVEIEMIELNKIKIGIIEAPYNVQGVLCARLLKDKPVLIINKYLEYAIGSLRVPENIEFDAGKFLKEISQDLNVLEGGGHEKAGGLTLLKKDLDLLIERIKRWDSELG
ncbi:MAG: DHHA1 domain-containing protein [Candidatus Woesearchaeota archaeon]